MKTMSWILLFSMIFYCCSPVNTISHNQSDYLELNETLDDEKVSITLINGSVIEVENISVGLEYTSWLEPANNVHPTTTRIIPTWVIKHIEIKSGWYGFFTWWTVSAIIIAIPVAINWYNSWKESSDYDERNKTLAGLVAFSVGSAWGLVGGIPFGIIGSQVGATERYNLDISKNSTEINTDISKYFKAAEYYENDPIPITEVEPPILQPDGNYKINVSSLQWREQEIVVTWKEKRIRLPKSKVKNSWKSGDKSYIVIPAKIYENEFLGK